MIDGYTVLDRLLAQMKSVPADHEDFGFFMEQWEHQRWKVSGGCGYCHGEHIETQAEYDRMDEARDRWGHVLCQMEQVCLYELLLLWALENFEPDDTRLLRWIENGDLDYLPSFYRKLILQKVPEPVLKEQLGSIGLEDLKRRRG